MDHDLLAGARRLQDSDLLSSVQSLAELGRRTTAQVIAHLVEIERRGLHLSNAYESIFEYCRRGLRFSEGEAYNRMVAVRAARQFPVVLDMIADGLVTLTAVTILQRHLTAENHLALLNAACGRRKIEVEEIVARLHPQPDAPTTVRKESVKTTTMDAWTPTAHPIGSSGPAPPAPAVAAATKPAVVAPLSPERYRYQTTISAGTLAKLKAAKDLMRHAVPGGEDDAVLARALDVLLERLARQRFANSTRESRSRATARHSRHVPAAVKRAVVGRDGLRCAYVAADGQRCESCSWLEFEHRKPWMAGGDATTGNISIYCRAHNRHAARRYFDRGPQPTAP